jgi:hypothetical protein
MLQLTGMAVVLMLMLALQDMSYDGTGIAMQVGFEW